jgi:hypothetical protein
MFDTGPAAACALAGTFRELALDLLDVPADTVEGPVDVGAGQPPRLADLPHQQHGQQVAVLRHLVDGAVTRSRRSSRSTLLQSSWACRASANSLLGRRPVHPRRPWIGEPSTGVTWSPGRPTRAQSPPIRFRMRSGSNASGAS